MTTSYRYVLSSWGQWLLRGFDHKNCAHNPPPPHDTTSLGDNHPDRYPLTRTGLEDETPNPNKRMVTKAVDAGSPEIMEEPEKKEVVKVDSDVYENPIRPHKKSRYQKMKQFKLPPKRLLCMQRGRSR